MIVVTGATGRLGRRVVQALLEIVPARDIAISVRDPAKAADLAAQGVRVRRGDFAEPASLGDAFAGATRLLLVSSNAAASGGDPIAQHRDAIDAARAAGVRRIVYTSHMGASATSAFPPMRDHARTEAMLADCGIAWTALRNGFYASTVPQLIGDAAAQGAIEAPADGPVAWTAHADLATAAARVLVAGGHHGPTPPLTATDALNLDAVAGIVSDLTGKPVERRLVSDDVQASRLAAAGLPPAAVEITMGIYRAARAGEFAQTHPLLAELIGRPPVTLRDVLAGRAEG